MLDLTDSMGSPPPRTKPTPAASRPVKARPDANPMRVALGAAGLATLSALAGAIVLPPKPAVYQPVTYGQQAVPAVQYVQLQVGQTAPPGAMVISSSAQPVALAPPVVQKPVIIRTTQSGKVLP